MTTITEACDLADRALAGVEEATRALRQAISQARLAEASQPPPPHDGPQMLNARQAAKRIGVGVTKLYALMKAGEIEGVKVGASRRFRAADLDAWVRRLPASPA